MIGTWFMSGSPQVMDIISYNLDFVIIDMEHGNIDYNDLPTLIRLAGDAVVWVRPRSNNAIDIQHILDSGAQGIIVPHINTLDDVYEFIQYTEYPPIGVLGYSPFTAAYGYGAFEKCSPPTRAIIIESKEAVENIEQLAQNVDVVYIGIYDLSKEYGFGVHSEEMNTLFGYIANKILDQGKEIGAIYHNAETKKFLEDHQVDWMVYKTDTAIIFDATKDI